MSIDELRRVLPPPTRPRRTGSPEEWVVAEARLGLTFPSDVKAFTATYGDGVVGGSVSLLAPIGKPWDLWFSGIDQALSVFRDYQEMEGWDEWPYTFEIRPGGLMPWAVGPDVATLFWLIEGEPDTWPIVSALGFDGTKRYEETMTSLLAGWIAGRLVLDFFPPLDRDALFVPRPIPGLSKDG